MVKPDSEDAATLFAIMFPPLDFQYNSITIEGIIRFYLCKINKGSKEVSTVRELEKNYVWVDMLVTSWLTLQTFGYVFVYGSKPPSNVC